MHKRFRYLYLILISILVALPNFYVARPIFTSLKRYRTTKDYNILDNFKCIIEFGTGLPLHRLDNKTNPFYYPINGGIKIGYYISTYDYKPVPREILRTYDNKIYDPINKNRTPVSAGIDITREGKANFGVEIGIQIPHQERSNSDIDNLFKIIEKFVAFPIAINWSFPITIWGMHSFSSNAFGCSIKYLISSTYIPRIPTDNLRICKSDRINLKRNLPDLNLFSYNIFMRWGILFPKGISISLVGSIPLDIFKKQKVNQKTVSRY